MSSLSFHDKQHVLRLLNQQGQVKRIFDDFTRRSGLILTQWTEKNTDNVWIRNTTLEKQIDNLLTELHDNLLINIENNTTDAWEASNLKNDDLLKAYIKDLALPEIIGKSRYEELEKGMFARNMNALRVAVTQTNNAYHEADFHRWQSQGFVIGIRVFRSKSNHGPCPICDSMAGVYPKGFKFTSWHPFCICQSVPEMLEGEEYIDYLLTGVVPEHKIIKTVPQSAIDFVNAKEANQNQWFVKENKKYLLRRNF